MRYPQILVSLRFLVWFSTLGVFGVKPSTLAAVAVALFLLKSRSWDPGACVSQSTRLVLLRAQLASPMVPGEPSRNLHFFLQIPILSLTETLGLSQHHPACTTFHSQQCLSPIHAGHR